MDKAKHYFGLCGVARAGVCQYRLGRLLLDDPKRRERDLIQGVALLELAGEHGVAEGQKEAARNSRS